MIVQEQPAIPQSLQDVHLFVHFIEDMSIPREVTSCPFLLKGSAEGMLNARFKSVSPASPQVDTFLMSGVQAACSTESRRKS